MNIYVASSWRNAKQPSVVTALRSAGHEVYDFRNPTEGNTGFHWSDIDPDWQNWTPEQYIQGLRHPLADRGYKLDFQAMQWADVFVGVMPFGRSASLEMGWAAGNGKGTVLLLEDGEPELMVKMLGLVCCDMESVLKAVGNWRPKRINPAVLSFAETMQYKLDKNEHKPCGKMNGDGKGRRWDNCKTSWLFYRLYEEARELERAIAEGDSEHIQEEAADVGNFAMMIHDNISKV